MKPSRSSVISAPLPHPWVSAAVLALVFALVLAACGGGSETPVTGIGAERARR